MVTILVGSVASQNRESQRDQSGPRFGEGQRVYDTVRSLVADGAITRERVADVYLYLGAHPKRAALQMAARRQQEAAIGARPPDPLLVIDVLVRVLHHPREDAATIAAQLRASGRAVTPAQVEEVFHAYGVKKTAVRSRFPRSQV